jgi:HPP family
MGQRQRELVLGTMGEGGLILAIAAIGLAIRQPLIFASLGPTAYELVEQPRARSSRIYNIIVGHLLGLGSGFLALYLLQAWNAPNVLATGIISPQRIWAVTLAATLTTFSTLLLRASQPASLATTLLVSLGAMQTSRDAWAIVAGVVIITIIGEPMRQLRLRQMQQGGD